MDATRRALTAGLLAGLAACAGGGGWPSEGHNLLLVTVDTTRADALSCYGAAPGTTPRLDALAEAGVLFEEAYSATNVTKPSHLSILTGQRAIEHRVFNNQVLIPEEVEALPLWMKSKGFRTAAFVAAVQLGEGTAWRGFDVVEGPPPKKAQRVGEDVVDGALAWLAEGDEPFFLWTHFFDPHTLYTPPQEFARRFYRGDPREGGGPLIGEEPWFEGWEYKPMQRWIEGVRDPEYARGMYAAETAYMDAQIGRLFDHLEREGLSDRTVVAVVADHGEHFGEHGVWYDHAGLYETALRIPLILRVPGTARGTSGLRVDEPVTQLDLVPTFAELFGLGIGRTASGQSLVPFLTGERERWAERDTLVFESAHNHQIALRRGNWKLILPIVRDHRFLGSEPELFDLEADPGERRNLAEERPEVVEELAPLLQPWVELGTLSKGELPTMSDEVIQGLEDLGYLGDD